MSVRRPDARERRTIAAGAAVLAAALFIAFVIAPVARRWGARESAIGVARDRMARLLSLTSQQPQLVAAAQRGDVPAPTSVRVLRGRTPALVASDLQALLQDYARTSRVSVTRLEVSNAADSLVSPERGVSASISATTDIYGLGDLLSRVQSGSVLLSVDELSVAPNAVLRGNLLQVALTVRAPFVVEP